MRRSWVQPGPWALRIHPACPHLLTSGKVTVMMLGLYMHRESAS